MNNAPYALVVWFTYVCYGQNIAHVIEIVSRFMANLCRAHWEAIKSILRYLKGTKGKWQCYGKGPLELNGICDSDMESGYAYTLGGGAISWCSRLQG